MRRLDLTGQRFGRLLVRGCVGTKNGSTLWLCRCDCGKTSYVVGTNLKAGRTQSCGCLNIDRTREVNTKHGYGNTKLYYIYHAMHQRCYDKSFKSYHHYGGRGITVCEEWHDLDTFCRWALSHGYKEGLSIERKDVDGPYCPENCEWITKAEQTRNRRNTVYVTYHGETMPLSVLAEEKGLNRRTLQSRLERGWDIEDALKRPVEKKSRPSVVETEKAARKICAGDIIPPRKGKINEKVIRNL